MGDNQSKLSAFITLASFTLVAAILYFAKTVFIPLALAALLSFLLAPLMLRFMRWGMNRTAAIATSVIVSFSLMGVIGWLVTVQALHLVERLPDYQQNIRAKIAALKRPNAPGFLQKTSGMVRELKKELESKPAPDPNAVNSLPEPEPGEQPIPVEVKPPKPSSFELVRNLFGPLLGPLGTAAIVILLVVMILIQREDLRDRFIKLISGGQLNVATQAVDDAAQRLSRYLIMTLLINATYGIPIGVGLWLIGVPNAMLWGLLAILLRFIPFLGPWIAAAFPITLAIAADPGWTKLMMTVGLFVTVELVSNNVIEPWLYGQSTGISKLALVAAAIFWTWLWGPVGLFLSTPLTVCLMVMGKYVPGLHFLSVLLGSEPVLEPGARFYQRMLAMDEDELLNLADEYCAQHSVEEFYDLVLLPALTMAEEDRHSGTLAEVRQQFILQSSRDLIQDLYERDAPTAPVAAAPEGAAPIVCVPARDDADELAGLMLRHVLTRHGHRVKVFSVASLPAEIADSIRAEPPSLVCVSAVPPAAVVPARSLCKRLKEQFPDLLLVAGIWSAKAQPLELTGRFSHWAASVLTRLTNAAVRIAELKSSDAGSATTALPPRPVRREADPEELLGEVIREVAKVFHVPVSLVSLSRTNRAYWDAHLKPSPDDDENAESVDGGLCSQVETGNQLLVVEDIAQDPRLKEVVCFKERGIRFFAGAPLCNEEGHAVGTLWLTDAKPHRVADRQKESFRAIAEKFMKQLNTRQLAAA